MEFKEKVLENIDIEIIDGDRGKNYPNGDDFKKEKYCLFLNAKNVTYSGFEFSENMFISREKDNILRKGKLKRNDIVLTTRGTVGNVGFYSNDIKYDNIRINSGMVIIRNNDFININNKYIYWYLKSPKIQGQIMKIKTGSAQPQLPISILKKLKIILPDKKIQDKITKILDNIEQKIKLNNQINDNLHDLADILYKGWFIDFKFPGFNGKLKKTNLGLIPENWKIEKLENIADCQNGYAFYKDGYDADGLMVIDLGNINLNGTFIYTNADKYIQRERVNTEKFNKYKVYKNDLIMVMTDRKATMELLGKTGKIYENKEFLLNQRMYRIRSKVNTNFLYTALNNGIILNKLKNKALGSVQKYVNTGHIKELEFIVGTDEIMDMFSELVDPIYAEIENRTVENTRLEKLRNTLLPKLMNGEIDLRKIEI